MAKEKGVVTDCHSRFADEERGNDIAALQKVMSRCMGGRDKLDIRPKSNRSTTSSTPHGSRPKKRTIDPSPHISEHAHVRDLGLLAGTLTRFLDSEERNRRE